jgi:hypothetical protein
MLIQRQQPTAICTLSARTDVESYTRIRNLADDLNTSPSVLLRLAIVDLLARAKKAQARNLEELMKDNNYGH